MIEIQTKTPHLNILGGGPAGLAAGYFARQKGAAFTIFEAGAEVGGNCRTLSYGNFFFDLGAHRFHDQDAASTEVVMKLLGDELKRVDAPSQVYCHGKFVRFPLAPGDLLRKLGIGMIARAGTDFLRARLTRMPENPTFEELALHRYGRTLAKAFLINYSEKLWGLPANRLSPQAAGKRLRGLRLRTFLIETLAGARRSTRHMEGNFYYPRQGIGEIPKAFAKACGIENVRLNARITGLLHDGKRITDLEINGTERVKAETLISTLPLSLMVKMLKPAAPDDVRRLADGLTFQNVILVVLTVKRDRLTPNASLYFPGTDVPFTRICEPKNRSSHMSPEGNTSLAAEIPCRFDNPLWKADDSMIVEMTAESVCRIGLVNRSEIIGGCIHRLPFAYPVLETGIEAILGNISEYLSRFANLRITGRNGMFSYVHVHDLIRAGREEVEAVLN